MRTWIRDVQIVNEGVVQPGSVLIDDTYIAQVLPPNAPHPSGVDSVVDGAGCLLLPGVIDDHVHFREPGLTHKADMFTESCAAVAGGVTSYMDMPNCKPTTVTLEALAQKYHLAAQKSVANYSFYFGATNDNAHLLAQLDPRRVCGVKLFMGSSTGNMLVDDDRALREVFASAPMLIAAHCEDPQLIDAQTAHYGALYAGRECPIALHSTIRSREACLRSARRAVHIAKDTGARLHLLHLSTAEEIDLLGGRVTGEATPAHLLFSDADYHTLGTRIKCNPAIKTMADRSALRQAVQAGTIAVIGTDHAPHLMEEKVGGALKAVSGMPMIQFSLVSMLQLFSPEIVAERMCHAPARLYDIAGRGFVRPGYKADLVLVDAHHAWTLEPSHILSRCGWSPLLGHRFSHRVVATYVNGHRVYDGTRVDVDYRGEALQFDRQMK